MLLNAIALLFLVSGALLYFGISVRQLAENAAQRPRQPPSAYEIITGKKPNALVQRFSGLFREMHDTLEAVGLEKQYPRYCGLSGLLAAGAAIFSLMLSNWFLLPVAALLGMYIPVLLARLSAAGHKKRQDAEIQTGLSIITSSYKRTDNLLLSVSENISYLHEPVKTAFSCFLAKNEFLTTNVEKSLYELKTEIHNSIWAEWCDAMILCMHDHTQKDMLDAIITKLRNVDTVQMELDAILYKPIRTFVQMAVMVLANYPIMYFINPTWFHYLMFSIPGKIATAVVAAVMIFALSRVIKATRPIEYIR